MRSMNVKAAWPAVFLLCAVLLTLGNCEDMFRSKGPSEQAKPEEGGGGASDTVPASSPQYTVAFDAAGGSPAIQARTVNPGSSLGYLPPAPDRDGHAFGGWFTGWNGGGKPFTASAPVTADITVYAKWTEVLPTTYTVTFDAGEGSVSPDPVTVTGGSSLGSLPEAPTKDGSTFGHWYTSEDGEEEPFTASTAVTADITVHAKWLVNAYTVTFDPGEGGNVSQEFQAVDYNTPLGILLPTPVRSGHTFGGWYTAADGGGEEFTASTAVTANITVYATWTINQYTVTFNAREGSVSPSTLTAEYNTPLGTLPTPTRGGHTFGGWYTAADGGDPFTDSTAVTADITVYATWTINQYTVTFNTDGGNVSPPPVTVNYNTPLGALLPVATKPEYTFGGWYTAADGGGDPFTASTAVTADITVYARWTINQYTVTFNAREGSVSPSTRTAEYNTPLGTLPTPTRSGHTFGGWYTAANGGGDPFIASTKVTADITVYAKWTINQYKVTFDAAGGNVSPPPVTVNYNTTLGASLPTPTKPGHTFGGWYTAANGGDPFTASTKVTADIKVYAKWTINQYTVTFNPDGGNVSPATRTVNYNTPLGALLPVATKPEYIFDGWYTAANGGGALFTASTPVTAHITVYAKWLATVKFDTDGGSAAPPPVTVAIGSSIHSLPAAPTKTGHAFGGWYTARNGGGDPFTASTKVTGSKTVYAKWIPRYTVTFNADGGSVSPASVTVTSGTTLSSLPIPTRNAWDTFGGWYTAADGGGTQVTASTPVTKNMTVYAKWNTSPQAFFDWVKSNAVDGGNYTYTLEANESIANIDLNYGGKKVSITLEGDSQERIVSLSNSGSVHFWIQNGVTLTLGNNLTLQGRSDNGQSSVSVKSGGTLVMNDGSKICDNSAGKSSQPNNYCYGGGVAVNPGGAFTMNGGEISGNSCDRGAGVYVRGGGTFTMNGGIIKDNTAFQEGGGVFVGGTFTKTGGTVTGNTPNDVVP